MKRLGLCFRCLNRLKNGHFSKDCRVKCGACKGDHNVLMCGVKLDLRHRETKDNRQKSPSTVVDAVEEEVSSNFVAMLSSQMRQKTVLQTVKVRALTSDGKIVSTAKLLFDNGCDRCYISNKFVKRSQPKWIT